MSVLSEAKIDCHNHVFDPVRFPYAADAVYRPAGQEVGTPAAFRAVMDAHDVRHALLVGPNSGYGPDNGCLLDTIAGAPDRFRGVAVLDTDRDGADLGALKRAGIVGVAINPALHGLDAYRAVESLADRLAEAGLLLQVQTDGDMLADLLQRLTGTRARLVVDHCGRPDPALGLGSRGFSALLALARDGRGVVKLSGQAKFSREPYPYRDTWPFVAALLAAFGPERCVWGSDWPFLRAPERIDYGPLLVLAERLMPDPAVRRAVFWDTPRTVFGFDRPYR